MASSTDNSISVVDWISAVSSLVAAIISIITLITVYAAALQILSERRRLEHLYNEAISVTALGSWQPKVFLPSSLLRMRIQREIRTPNITLTRLVKKKWNPEFTFPLATAGLHSESKSDISRIMSMLFPGNQSRLRIDTPDLESRREYRSEDALADTTWVNFLQALGLSPNKATWRIVELWPHLDGALYNGRIPMKWKGKDLLAICSLLGFQSPSDLTTKMGYAEMKLPTHWSGPLGWMKFRASDSHDCIVEFRRKAYTASTFSTKAYIDYYRSFFRRYKGITRSSYQNKLICALWRTVHGLYIPDDAAAFQAVYLGGSYQAVDAEHAITEGFVTMDSLLFRQGVEYDYTEEEIKRMIDEVNQKKRWQSEKVASTSEDEDYHYVARTGFEEKKESDETTCKARIRSSFYYTLAPCPGLIDAKMERDQIDSRGLVTENVHELLRKPTSSTNIDRTKYPYKLGRLFMDEEVIKLLKPGLINTRPSGFYFTASERLSTDLAEIYAHFQEECDYKAIRLIVDDPYTDLNDTDWTVPEDAGGVLFMAIHLCHHIQYVRSIGHAHFTVMDMTILADTCDSLLMAFGESNLKYENIDQLRWAFLICPDFLTALRTKFATMQSVDIVEYKSMVVIEDGILTCPLLTAKGKKKGNVNGSSQHEQDTQSTGPQNSKLSEPQKMVPVPKIPAPGPQKLASIPKIPTPGIQVLSTESRKTTSIPKVSAPVSSSPVSGQTQLPKPEGPESQKPETKKPETKKPGPGGQAQSPAPKPQKIDGWKVPLSGLGKTEYSGEVVLSAFLYTYLTYVWVDLCAFPSDISPYYSSIPAVVLMC